MDYILFYLKQSISILNQNRILIVPSFIILSLVLNFSFYSMIKFSKLKLPNSSTNSNPYKENKNFLRFLSEKVGVNFKKEENEEIKLFNLLEAINSNVTELALYYEFVENITSHSYYGKWENLKMDKDKNNFIDKSGEIELNFQKKTSKNYLLSLNQKNRSNISVSFIIKDGEYIDNYIVGNFSFNFKNIPLISYLSKSSFSIYLENINLTYAYGHYMDIGKKLYINKTNINMTFYKKPEQYINKINHIISSTEYSQLDFHIKSIPDLDNNNVEKKNLNNKNENKLLKNFEISFTSKAYGVQKYPIKILNYSILLTFAAFIEIYFSTKFLVEINENVQMALNIDLITVFIQIMWTALICGVNFFLSLTYEPLTYEYGMPSMTYFTLFSIFLLRILFIGWKSRYIELLFNDISQFRKKLFQFYLIFYCLLLCTLVSIKLWYTYFIFTFFLFGGTWIFQIIYSVKKGTKPPMPYSYIFITSLFKILIPIYLKAYNNNIFSLRPSYLKVFICISIVFVEAIIVSLQKLLGPKFFIPERYREPTFDYYKAAEEIPENKKSGECVICLENLDNLEINNREEDDEVFKTNGNYIEKLAIMIQKWNKKKHNKPYMQTPCAHIFHTRCLETWLEIKNECPYCRQKIPPLES